MKQSVTIVTGTNDCNTAAAERLQKILAPWGVTGAVDTAGGKLDPTG